MNSILIPSIICLALIVICLIRMFVSMDKRKHEQTTEQSGQTAKEA